VGHEGTFYSYIIIRHHFCHGAELHHYPLCGRGVLTRVTVTSGIKFGEADPYGILGSQDLLLDLYVPTGDTLEKRPLLIYAFGGGFLIGLRNQPPIPQFCEHFARLGYVVASIDYRIGFTTTSTGSAERGRLSGSAGP
jgi:hypothetical protein